MLENDYSPLSRNQPILRERPYAELSQSQINSMVADLTREHTKVVRDTTLSEADRSKRLADIVFNTANLFQELLDRYGITDTTPILNFTTTSFDQLVERLRFLESLDHDEATGPTKRIVGLNGKELTALYQKHFPQKAA